MCTSSSLSSTSFSLLTNRLPLSHRRRRRKFLLTSPFPFLTRPSLTLRFSNVPFSSAIADTTFNDDDDVSWLTLDDSSNAGFNGWELTETPTPEKNTGFPKFWVAGVGTSVALLVAAIAQFALAKNGLRLPFRSPSQGLSTLETTQVMETEAEAADSDVPYEENAGSESVEVESSDVVTDSSMVSEKHIPRIITVSVDSNQQEALNVLKKLKVINEDVEANELCSRREYARWLIRATSLLERNPKYKITTTAALSGSVISAFEDVSTGDQDFESIQALAEAGVVLSKLSPNYDLDYGGIFFSPERFISRRDLIDWRAQLEYDFAVTGNQEILKTKLDLLDVREISSDKLPGLLMDMLAGDKSLLRRVFGQIRRLQPNKPSTVAQAAVALTSGRMKEAINTELLRIQADKSSRQAAKADIKCELLDRGEIQRYWNEKTEEERTRGLEVQQLYIDVIEELEQEKIVQEGAFHGHLKEKAAMECQKQLLNGLKQDVSEMSERLITQKAEQIAEEETVHTLRCDLETKKEGIVDAKSLLEAEIDALRILRSWIENEARKSQARWKVLEEARQRWKWDRQE